MRPVMPVPVGQVFGRLTVLREGPRIYRVRTLVCACVCGNETTVRWPQFKRGLIRSCGCLVREKRPNARPFREDVAGQRFGSLVVLERTRDPRGRPAARCRCDCGTETTALLGNLRSGMTRTCGCGRLANGRTHGATHTPEYGVWNQVIQRCTNPRAAAFANYGGRGITICDRWRVSFEAFLADMGPRPSDAHSIDRVRNDGPYSPENCRWATAYEQARNTRRNVWVEFAGERRLLSDVAREHGVSRQLAFFRVKRGWDQLRAATTPPQRQRAA